MAVSNDLFLSILAMDTYNRGYNAGVKGLKDTPDTYIGTARIASDTTKDPDAFDAGFYAIAYEFSGQTVLAFRGTDNYSLSGDYTPNGPGGSDVWSGWTITADYAAASQAGLAIKFYEDVTGATSVFQTALNATLIGPWQGFVRDPHTSAPCG